MGNKYLLLFIGLIFFSCTFEVSKVEEILDDLSIDEGPGDDRPDTFTQTKPVILWTYQFQPICKDGRNDCPDIPRTEQAIKDLGATGLFIGLSYKNDYQKLLGFLEATKNTAIKIWVKMHHNCFVEPPPYKAEFRGDCTRWVEHVAELSTTYPNLQVLLFDDLHPTRDENVDLITPSFLKNLIDAKDKINPKMKFLPTLYYDVYDELQFFRAGNPFQGVLRDGSTMWYWASYGGRNRVTNMAKLKSFIDEAKLLFPPAPFITGIYSTKCGDLQNTNDVDQLFHSPERLREMLELSYSESDGLGLFNFPLYLYDLDFLFKSTIFQQQQNDDPAYNHKLTNSEKGTYNSWYQSIAANVSVPSGANVRIRFDIRDTLAAGDEGYLFKQLVVNDKVVWEVDVCSDNALKQSVDNTVKIEGTSANISIRLFSKRANWIRASLYVTNPIVNVNGTQVSASWKFDSNLSKIKEYKDVYDITKSVIKKH